MQVLGLMPALQLLLRVPDILCNLLITHSWPQAFVIGLTFLILAHVLVPRTLFQQGI